jgi:hypothetical protein
MENLSNILVGKPKERNHSEEVAVDGRITFDWILGRLEGKLFIGFI